MSDLDLLLKIEMLKASGGESRPASLTVASKIFEEVTLTTKAGNFARARMVLDAMGALHSLVTAANEKGDQEASYILGDLSSVSGGEKVFDNMETYLGVYYHSVTRDGKLFEAAREVIQDIIKVDASTLSKGPEYSIDASHYVDQLNKMAPADHHIVIDEKRGVPLLVTDAPEMAEPKRPDGTAEWIAAARRANERKPGNM